MAEETLTVERTEQLLPPPKTPDISLQKQIAFAIVNGIPVSDCPVAEKIDGSVLTQFGLLRSDEKRMRIISVLKSTQEASNKNMERFFGDQRYLEDLTTKIWDLSEKAKGIAAERAKAEDPKHPALYADVTLSDYSSTSPDSPALLRTVDLICRMADLPSILPEKPEDVITSSVLKNGFNNTQVETLSRIKYNYPTPLEFEETAVLYLKNQARAAHAGEPNEEVEAAAQSIIQEYAGIIKNVEIGIYGNEPVRILEQLKILAGETALLPEDGLDQKKTPETQENEKVKNAVSFQTDRLEKGQVVPSEDRLRAEQDESGKIVIAVADGHGRNTAAYGSAELASAIATEVGLSDTSEETNEVILNLYQGARTAIRENPEMRNGGTTLTVAIETPDRKLTMAKIGDSPCFVVRKDGSVDFPIPGGNVGTCNYAELDRLQSIPGVRVVTDGENSGHWESAEGGIRMQLTESLGDHDLKEAHPDAMPDQQPTIITVDTEQILGYGVYTDGVDTALKTIGETVAGVIKKQFEREGISRTSLENAFKEIERLTRLAQTKAQEERVDHHDDASFFGKTLD